MSAQRSPLEYDWELKRVDVDGVEIAYIDVSGPGADPEADPVLLVHGVGASIDHWALAIPLLSQKRRVIALDLPGFGFSAKPIDRQYDPETYVGILAAFLDRLEIARVELLGHSMGGAVCSEFTLAHSKRVAHLVLVDAAGMTRAPTRLLDYLVERFERRIDPKKIVLPPRVVRALMKIVFYNPVPFATRNMDRLLAIQREPDWPQRVVCFVRAVSGVAKCRVRERLADFKTPTLIVWGEKDRVLPLRHGRMLQAGILGSRIVVFPKTGHVPMIEKPEEFCRVVEEFLERGRPVP